MNTDRPMTTSVTQSHIDAIDAAYDQAIQAALALGRGDSVIRPRGLGKRTHICGMDNGKSKLLTLPRNAPCPCGSGRKAKRCCVHIKREGSGDGQPG
jgi:uncharacterized protein YecA (UPF0149 family)